MTSAFASIFGDAVVGPLVDGLVGIAFGKDDDAEKHLQALEVQLKELSKQLEDSDTGPTLQDALMQLLASHQAIERTFELALVENEQAIAQHIRHVVVDNTWLVRDELAEYFRNMSDKIDRLPTLDDFRAAIGELGLRLDSIEANLRVLAEGSVIFQQAGELSRPLSAPPPEFFVGRDQLCADVTAALANGGHALLHGVGGIGKTAVAAVVGRDWLAEQQGPGVLWLTARSADLTGLLSGIGSAFGPEGGRAVAAAVTCDDKLAVVRSILGQVNPLVVLDDVWDGPALATLLKQGFPPGVPVLVTSRTHFSITPAFDVRRLPRPDALTLLRHHAGRDLPPGDADGLCDDLGDHPYAVEIA
ncbi:MAG: hypothetical protein JW910_14005, partial [Anaerolineae bacterium]|nr:hypothetical protein [Anaerolineae bacterium]